MNKQIKAGADIHAGDGGYSEGTQEQYDAFVKVRNKSLAQGRIRLLAEQAGFKTNWQHEDVQAIKMARFEKFAELIVRECGEVAYKAYWDDPEAVRGIHIQEQIKRHFGIE
jgi:hypothetical protein